MLATKDIKHTYPASQQISFPDLNLSNDQQLLILGKSGIGKSTLLHILGLILKPTAGSLNIHGTDIFTLPPSALARFRASNVGMVYQKAHFISSLTVLENLLLANYLAQKPQDLDRAHLLLDRMNIRSHGHKYPHQLSIGEQQRLGIARALMNHPPLVLADEPTSALDDASASAVADLLLEQSDQEKAALVIVTHDARLKSKFSQTITL